MKEKAEHTLWVYTDKELRPCECDEKEVSVEGDIHLFQGHSLGLAYVAPIGMQNLFVINSAMSQKLRRAIVTALIVIFWDISLALACFLGVGALIENN